MLHMTLLIIAWLVGMQPVQDPVKWVLLPAFGTALTICLLNFSAQPKLQASKHPFAGDNTLLTKRQMTKHHCLSFDQQTSAKATVL